MSEGEKEESMDGVGGASPSAVVRCEHYWLERAYGALCWLCHSVRLDATGTFIYGQIRPATESTGGSEALDR